MEYKPNINNRFFGKPVDNSRMSEDPIAGERRKLINRFKDGELTTHELRTHLIALKNDVMQ